MQALDHMDVGRFVGRYFQVLAVLSVAHIMIQAAFFDTIRIDFSFLLLLWAAGPLMRHQPVARKWVLGVLGFILCLMVGILVVVVWDGMEGVAMNARGESDDPGVGRFALVFTAAFVAVGLPFALLVTPKAQREFAELAGL